MKHTIELEYEQIEDILVHELKSQFSSLKNELDQRLSDDYTGSGFFENDKDDDCAEISSHMDAVAKVLSYYMVFEDYDNWKSDEDFGSLMKTKDYVVVTTISSHRMRYVMHRDDLQKLNPSEPVNAPEWANDTVIAEECEEFSQEHMGEYIVDTVEMNEEDMLEMFDKDNDYLREWTKDQKIEWIRKTISDD